MTKARKRRIKWFRRRKGGKVYRYPYLGYYCRNEKGTPTFVREVSLTGLPEEQVEAMDRGLRGTPIADPSLVPVNGVRYEGSVEVGATWTALRLIEQLGVRALLNVGLAACSAVAVTAMILDRVVSALPHSKRALCAGFPSSALARILRAAAIPLHKWYRALDELYRQQTRIEAALATDITDRIFLYDITSVYFEGKHCPLADWGYNRDGKKGKKQIVVGLLTNARGRPLAVRVFRGNTKDETTVVGQMDRLREQFGADEFIFVGDRGMLTGNIRAALDEDAKRRIDYITALPRAEIMSFIEADDHPFQPGLFDWRNLVEVVHEHKRYILYHNPEKRLEDERTRERLLNLTEEKLESVARNVRAGRYKREKVIAKRLYRWLDRWGMGKFFSVDYAEAHFEYARDEQKIQQYSNLDGCYVIVTTLTGGAMGNEEVVARYKSLAQIEKAWRMMKTADEFVRPVRHWSPTRVCGHVFMCMLAYLTIWRARECFAPFLERDADRTCEGDSLREMWEGLDRHVTIGTLNLNGETTDQLSPIPVFQRRLLAAAGATIGPSERERLGVV